MPYQGWKKEEEEQENKQENTSGQTPVEALSDPKTGGARSDIPYKNEPGVNQNANSLLRRSYYDTARGDYEKARDDGKAYIRQLQSLIDSRDKDKLKETGLNQAEYERQQFQRQAEKANANDELLRSIRGAYNRDNMPVREKNVEQGGTGVYRGAVVPWEEGQPGMVGEEAPWSPIDHAYQQTPSGGYNSFSYGDDFGDPFNAQQYPYIAQNLNNPISALPEYLANYVIPGMDHFPTQEELEQLYDTGLW